MTAPLYLVAGAPGAGKSTVVELLLKERAAYSFFDIDWIVEPASRLVGRDIRFAVETWEPYGEVWFAVLHAVVKNGGVPVLFTPSDPSDFGELPYWCSGLTWLLLDCDAETRLARLRARGWDEPRIAWALGDAALMRTLIPRRLETSTLTPAEVAAAILAWLELDEQKSGVVCE